MTEDDQTRITFRMPVEVRDRIAELAKANNRSMNAEIIARLEWSFAQDDKAVQNDQSLPEIDPDELAEIERRAAEWGCSKTRALIRMTIEEMDAKK